MTDKHREATAAIRSGSGRPMTIRELNFAADRFDKRTAAEREQDEVSKAWAFGRLGPGDGPDGAGMGLAERLQTATITSRGR